MASSSATLFSYLTGKTPSEHEGPEVTSHETPSKIA